MLKAGFRNLPI